MILEFKSVLLFIGLILFVFFLQIFLCFSNDFLFHFRMSPFSLCYFLYFLYLLLSDGSMWRGYCLYFLSLFVSGS